MDPIKRITIVGGGLAGISAALEAKLTDPTVEVLLLEGRNRLGGATWSFTKDGVSYDNGQHVFLKCCSQYLEFLERIDSQDSVYLQPRLKVPVVDMTRGKARYAKISRRGKFLLGSLLCYRHLSISKRFRAIRTAIKLRKLDLENEKLDEKSFADWLLEQGESEESILKLWNLIVLPTLNLDAVNASLKLAAKIFITSLLVDARGADIGWGLESFSQLHDKASQVALAKLGVKVELNAKVERFEFDKEATEFPQHKIHTTNAVYESSLVILALPHTADIFPAEELSINQQALGVSPILNVHFVFDRQIMKTDLLAGVGTDIQFVFDRTQAAGLKKSVSSNQQCLAISLSAADSYLPQNAKELEQYFYKELLKIFPHISSAELLHSMVTRENAATFRGAPASHTHRAKTKTLIGGVFLAGAWTDTGWPATMEGAVRSGKKAAQIALN